MINTVFLAILLASSSVTNHGQEPDCGNDFIEMNSLLEPGAVLLVGEIHGTAEIPQAFGELVCLAADSGQPVLVGLEMTTDQLASIKAYLAGTGSDDDRTLLLEHAHWKNTDGRSSAAMLGLLDKIRMLRKENKVVEIFLFDDQGQKSSQARDKAMARHVAAALKTSRDAVRLLLTGNIHSNTRKGSPWDEEFESMGFYLKKDFPGILNVFAAYSGGTAWVCTPACGTTELSGKPQYAERGIDMYPEDAPFGADVVLRIGPITASLPALQ